MSDRIARGFNRSGATQAVALDISKAFDRVWHAGLLHKLKSYEIRGQIFGLLSSFLSNRQFQVVLNGNSFFCLMCVMERVHASTPATSLMRLKNNLGYFIVCTLLG